MFDMPLDFLKGKTVLITGGTGSFGQKCVHILLEKSEASRIIIFSRDEFKQSEMQNNIADPSRRLRFFIGDIRDKERLLLAFRGVDYVLHAAALKQVPALEYNPFEAIKTNIIGTKNVIDAALDQGVKKVVLISTDKAANPANLYGATKLCAERLIISGNAYSGDRTKFSIVRYGNVVGSRGSLTQVIKEQKKTGEVFITHEEMTRFWITLDQGVGLALMALEKMRGGEIFVPKIPSMKVKDFISVVAEGCRVKVVGIRPGEKLHEVLITPEEPKHTIEFKNYFIIFPEANWWAKGEYNECERNREYGEIFSSNCNRDWIDGEQLKILLNSI